METKDGSRIGRIGSNFCRTSRTPQGTAEPGTPDTFLLFESPVWVEGDVFPSKGQSKKRAPRGQEKPHAQNVNVDPPCGLAG
jgi:hypothetical protein